MFKRLLVVFGFVSIFILGYLIGNSENIYQKSNDYYQDIIPIYENFNKEMCQRYNQLREKLLKYEKSETMLLCVPTSNQLPPLENYDLEYLP